MLDEDESIEAVLAEMRQAIAEIDAETREVNDALAEQQKADAAEEEDIAAARRKGEHGRDWQTVQQNIDLGRTTLDDVITGVDHTPEAEAIRRAMQKLLPSARAQFADIVEESDREGEFTSMREAQAELARAVEQLRQLNLDL